MPTDEFLAAPPPPVVAGPSASPVHLRVRQGMRRPHNWLQLLKFCVVGGSGYVVNLAVFTAAVWAFDLHHLVAATLAFVVAVTNNFWWNRHWTFAAGEGRARFQAPRFFAVSVLAFLVQAAILDALVVLGGMGVPTHAVTRPSRCHPIAAFSLVASAWKSTRTCVARARSSARIASTSANDDRAASRKTCPMRLTTPRLPPPPSTTVKPWPGLPLG